MKKIISVILSVVLLLYTFTTVSFAADISMVTGKNDWGTGGVETTVTTIRGNAIGIMQAIGVSIAIVMLVVIGIKYLTSAPEDKAQIKSYLVIYVVGAVLIFGASSILGIVYTFVNQHIND